FCRLTGNRRPDRLIQSHQTPSAPIGRLGHVAKVTPNPIDGPIHLGGAAGATSPMHPQVTTGTPQAAGKSCCAARRSSGRSHHDERKDHMSNLDNLEYWIRSLPEKPHELADDIRLVAKLKDFEAELNAEIDGLEAKRRRLDEDIAKLETEKVAKFHEVAAIIPETQGQARTILEAAQSKADELVRGAAGAAAKMKADAG